MMVEDVMMKIGKLTFPFMEIKENTEVHRDFVDVLLLLSRLPSQKSSISLLSYVDYIECLISRLILLLSIRNIFNFHIYTCFSLSKDDLVFLLI